MYRRCQRERSFLDFKIDLQIPQKSENFFRQFLGQKVALNIHMT
jgi:hypothetical protein